MSVPTVTLSGVSFANNTAIGGGSTFSFGNGLASGGGGGGVGAGGAIFVMAGASVTVTGGSFASNTVTGGSGGSGNNGSAYGADLFLGGTVTFNVPTTLTVNSLGGAGNTSDPNVAGRTSDPNAQGGVVKTGAGSLVLSGSNHYVGPTTVRSGTLALAVSALEQGTGSVTVGLNSGDIATLALDGSSTLTPGGFSGPSGNDLPVMLAQNAGTLATAGAAAALGGVGGITVNTGGLLALGQTGGINDAASLTLAGGSLQTAASLTETLGGLTVSGSSLIDFLGNASTLNFGTLTLAAPLAIWNYTGGFSGTSLMPMSESATLVAAGLALLAGMASLRRRHSSWPSMASWWK